MTLFSQKKTPSQRKRCNILYPNRNEEYEIFDVQRLK